MQGIFQKENTDKALKYGIYRHLPTYEKIIRNLVSFLVKNKYRIYEVRLNAILDDENKEIQKYINKLQKEDNQGVLDKLLQELHWYNFDEGIDICNLSFGRKINNVFCQAHIANNGVVFVDNSSFQTDVVSILGSIL